MPLNIGYDVVIECSGVAPAREMAVLATKRWGESSRFPRLHWLHEPPGTCVFIGGYNDVTLQVSPWVIQKQLTIKGSWTCCKSAPVLEAKEVHQKLTCRSYRRA